MTLGGVEGVLRRLRQGGAVVGSASLFLMMAIGAVDVLTTDALGAPIPTAREATEALMVIVIFMSMAHTQAARAHITVDIFFTRFPPRLKAGVRALSDLLSLVLFLVIAFQGWQYAMTSLRMGEFAEGLISFPVYPAKIALAVGVTLLVLQVAKDVTDSVRACVKGRSASSGMRNA